MIVKDDILRSARTAIKDGRFRDAHTELRAISSPVRRTAEWGLLSAMAGWRLGNFDQSLSTAVQTRDRYRAMGDVDGEMRAENVAAAGAFALGDLDVAKRGFIRARSLAHGLHDDLMVARCSNNLGNVSLYAGNLPRALGYYSVAVSGFETIGFKKGLVEARHNMSGALKGMGHLPAARKAADRAIDMAIEIGDKRLLGQAMAGKADILVLQTDYRLAKTQTMRALDLARKHDDPLTEIEALRVLSLVEQRSGSADEALSTALRALEIASKVEHIWMKATIEKHLGSLYADRGLTVEASAAYEEAADNYDRLGSKDLVQQMRQLCSELPNSA